MNVAADRELLTIADVQRIAGIPRREVFSAVASGELPSVRDNRFRIRVRRRELERWAHSRN